MDASVIPCSSLIRLANMAELARIKAGIDNPELPIQKMLAHCNNVLGDHYSSIMALEYSSKIAQLNLKLISLVEDHSKFNPLGLSELNDIQEVISRLTLILAGYNVMISKRILEIKEGF